jgi:hypothetical protein
LYPVELLLLDGRRSSPVRLFSEPAASPSAAFLSAAASVASGLVAAAVADDPSAAFAILALVQETTEK